MGGILVEARSDQAFDLAGKPGIALDEPAAEGDAVGLVVELLGIELVEAVQFGILQNLGVQGSHTVGGVGEVNIHMRHMHRSVPVDDGKALVCGAGSDQRIQLLNDRHELGHNGFQIGAGPLFQCLCQNGVIGIGAGFCHDLGGFLKSDSVLTQQADQLRDNHAGVGVVDLNGSVVGKVVIVAAPGSTFRQYQLCAGGDHQILLVNPQLAACLVGIIRVQEQRQILVNGGLIKSDTVSDDALIHCVDIKQIQRVGAALKACDRQFVQPGSVCLASKGDGVGDVRFFRPAMLRKPGIGQLLLYAICQ